MDSAKGAEGAKIKLQKICDALKAETLEPAKQEAREILENAEIQKNQIIAEAKNEAQVVLKNLEKELSEKRSAFEASMKLASRQMLDELKLMIEKKIFNENVGEFVANSMAQKEVVAELMGALLKAMEKEGLDGDFSVYLGQMTFNNDMLTLLREKIFGSQKSVEISLGDFLSGFKIKIREKKITLDMSDEAVRETIIRYLADDFRKLFFIA